MSKPEPVERIWKAEIRIEVYLSAPTEARAYSDAGDRAEDSADILDIHVEEVKVLDDVPTEWRSGIPYGGERGDDRPLKDRLPWAKDLPDPSTQGDLPGVS